VRRPQGYVTVTTLEGPMLEYDTMTCGHCNTVVIVKPGTVNTVFLVPDPASVFAPLKEVPGAGCRVCMRGVCLRCEQRGICVPLERSLEQMEQRGRVLQSVLG